MPSVQRTEVQVFGRRAIVHVGGEGDAVVLLHGGVGGAELHWDPIWTQLAARFRVVAPELPGVGDLSQPGLGTIAAYARWVQAILSALRVESAALVGNSFGAAIAWMMAAHNPGRCDALVLVNGTPIPRGPAVVRALARFPPTRQLLIGLFRRKIFSAAALAQGLAAPERAPAALRQTFESGVAPQLPALVDAIVAGGDGAVPGRKPLLLWGAEDRFPTSDRAVAQKLAAQVPGARLVFVPRAGHLPQLENPEGFLGELVPFLLR